MDQTKLRGDHGGREPAVAGIVVIAVGVVVVGALVIIAATGGATG